MAVVSLPQRWGWRVSSAHAGGLPMSSDTPLAVSVRGVSKTYRIYERPQDRLWQALPGGRQRYTPFNALHDISFDVRRGETVGIVGVNGSGKSTLLQIICGTMSATTGSVNTAGRVAALLELGTGFDPGFTGRENVYLNAALFGLSRAEVDSRFDRIETFADIGPFIDRPVKTYSTGMVVRLAFAVVANIDADVLVVDEALAVGDAFFVQKCMRFMRGFMARGTLLFVSHDTGAVANLCDRAIWLHDGYLVMDDRATTVAETYLECLAEQTWGGERGSERADHIRRLAATRAASQPSAPPPVQAEPVHAPTGHFEVLQSGVEGRSFGEGGARITAVALLDEQDAPVVAVRGGDVVTVSVRASTRVRLSSPIIGFIVKDRLGQTLFAQNTFESHQGRVPELGPGDHLEARFTFIAPILAPGDYVIGVAIADGTQTEHIQHHWIHEAMVFRSVTRSVATGLMGIPMRRVSLRLVPGNE
jgi:lipopolysaccharide transport system ATP-binding protein